MLQQLAEQAGHAGLHGLHVHAGPLQPRPVRVDHGVVIAQRQHIPGPVHHARVHDAGRQLLRIQPVVPVVQGADIVEQAVIHRLLYIGEQAPVQYGIIDMGGELHLYIRRHHIEVRPTPPAMISVRSCSRRVSRSSPGSGRNSSSIVTFSCSA